MSTSSKNRIFQVVISIVVLILAAILIKDKSTLSGIVSDVNDLLSGNSTESAGELIGELVGDLLNQTEIGELESKLDLGSKQSTGLNLDTVVKPIAVSLASGSFTTSGNLILSLVYKFIKNRATKPTLASVRSGSGALRSLGVSKSQVGYLGSLVSSEFSGVILWFVSFIYQVTESGSMNCDSLEDLLVHYNLTGNGVNEQILNNFYGIGTIANSTLSRSSFNSTTLQKQLELAMKLSGNCKTKKASIGLASLGLVTYLLSSSMLGVSGYKLYSAYKGLKQGDNDSSDGDEANTLVLVEFNDAFLFPSIHQQKADEGSEDGNKESV